ncbi:MAG: metallophosphoesterase [Cytophagaceae bacterium]
MKKNYTLFHFLLLLSLFPFFLSAQIIIDDFEDGVPTNWVPGSDKITLQETNGYLRVNNNAVGPNYEGFGKTFNPLNMSKHTKISVKMMLPTGSQPVNIRMDITDNNGFDSNRFPISFNLPADSVYHEYIFDFNNKFQSSWPAVNNLNKESIVRVYFFVNPARTAFTGTFFISDITLLNAQDPHIITPVSDWKYQYDGSAALSGWNEVNFDDNSWDSGKAKFGFSLASLSTTLDYGSDASNKPITAYFRKKFEFIDTTAYKNLILHFNADAGAIIYINGEEVHRYNMSSGSVDENTTASSAVNTLELKTKLHRVILPETLLDSGSNVIAAEVHLATPAYESMIFDLELTATTYKPGLVRGPYLQSATDTSIVIKWRTLQETDSKVSFGNGPANLSEKSESNAFTTEHEILIKGLTPDTKYFYSIGTSDMILSGGDEKHYFITLPAKGTIKPYNIWVIGDAGKTNIDQRAVRDAYYNYKGNTHTDAWLLLGDNAYNEGTDEEYQLSMFENMFEELMKNTVIWPTPGNHDLRSFINSDKMAPYYQIFTVPQKGEAGGVPSNTEAYYSYDIGNIHFISLDSYGTKRDSTEAMAAWLKQDLAAASNATWKIAYWHHPPYSKGSHNSDNNSDSESKKMVEMREQIIPLLEKGGVDLVLTGHSHNYERSYMIHGHYGYSNTFLNKPHIVNAQISGKKSQGQEYYKNPEHAELANIGTVYSVVGCSGLKSSSVRWTREPDNLISNALMYTYSNQHLGSMVIQVNKDTMTARFLDSKGVIQDDFTIIKDKEKEMSLVVASISNAAKHPEDNAGIVIYPNPTAGNVALKYTLDKASKVHIELLDASGKKIKEVYTGRQEQGDHTHYIDLDDQHKDVVILKMVVNKNTYMRKIIRVR